MAPRTRFVPRLCWIISDAETRSATAAPKRFHRVRVYTVVLAGVVVAAFGAVVAGGASPPGAAARGRATGGLLTGCAKDVLGLERGSATPVSGSASPLVVSQLGVFRRTRSPADALPRAARLGASLAAAGARSFDPSAAVRLTRHAPREVVYAVPATVALRSLPPGCTDLPAFARVGPYLALQALETGSGPGVCLFTTQVQENGPAGPSLPGAPTRQPTRSLTVSQAVCESQAVLSGYAGAIGDALEGSAPRLAMVPDGISEITYTLADGRRFAVPVTGNLAAVPAALSLSRLLRNPTAAEFGRALTAQLPTVVLESRPGGAAATSLTRPVSLVGDVVDSLAFLRSLLRVTEVSGSSSSATVGASCSTRTHRCVAVTVTTTCDSHHRCHTSRRIQRYRYAGARPPAGTTGPDRLPTAPIVARTNRVVTLPAKLTLVLGGATQRQVVVLLSVSCFGPGSSETSGNPPLKLAVPSRTPIALPGRARSLRACDVGALVTSSQHGAVRVTVARG